MTSNDWFITAIYTLQNYRRRTDHALGSVDMSTNFWAHHAFETHAAHAALY